MERKRTLISVRFFGWLAVIAATQSLPPLGEMRIVNRVFGVVAHFELNNSISPLYLQQSPLNSPEHKINGIFYDICISADISSDVPHHGFRHTG